MKKIILFTATIVTISIATFAQDDPIDTIGSGSSCTSLGPDNNGYCTKYYNPGGADSYSCLSAGSGCINCVK